MRVFTNRSIRRLFVKLSIVIILSTALFQTAAYYLCGRFSFLLLGISLLTTAAVIVILLRYFKEQDKQLEAAAATISRILSGESCQRLNSDCEGELYYLFHEINMLASVLNAQAEREKHRGEFLKETISDISHQLKTPLAALNIYNGLIAEADSLDCAKKFAASSERELNRIEELIKSLLKLARFNAGAIILEKTNENIADIMENILDRFACRAELEGKKIMLSGSAEDTIFCDRGWLSEALGNIVKNALDHTARGGEIRINWLAGASTVTVSIADNGSGIHPDDISHIFKRFYRSRYSKDTQGLGLGLSLAKSIIEAHSGTIDVQSELNRGAVFTAIFVTQSNDNPSKL